MYHQTPSIGGADEFSCSIMQQGKFFRWRTHKRGALA
jgi:hypothetical protein